MREGVHRDGRQLYPAFPYTSFTRASDADLQALYAYLMAETPVRATAPAPALRFPFDQRPLMAGWNTLFHKAGAYARTLSGGMKRRLLVAKALVHNPPILVLDEPTAGVDIELRQQLWAYVRQLNDRGVTVVLTTHYLEEAEELCDRIAIINHGRVIADKPTRELVGMMGEKLVEITVDRDVSEPPQNPLFTKSEKTGERSICITYDKARVNTGQVLALVQQQGYAIEDVTTREADLEDVFVQLTSADAA